MNIRKLFFNNQAFYPATILQAIKDHTNGKTLTTLLQELRDAIATKVDKVTGKSLVLDTEITKLAQYPTLTTGTDKYVREDGSLSPIAIGSGGYAANLYLANAASDVAGYKTLSYTNDATATTVSGTSINNTEVLIEEFAYPLGIGVTSIDAGSWKFSLYGNVSNTGGETYARAKIYKRASNGAETLLFSIDSAELNNLVNERIVFESVEPIYAVSAADRLVVKLYVTTTSNANKTLTITVGGINPSFFNTPLSIRHNQLRAVNEDPNVQHMTAAQKTAVDALTAGAYQLKSEKNQANGYAGVDANGYIPISLIPRDTLEQLYAYGIERDITVSSTACTRVGNLDMHRTLPIQSLMRGCLLDDDGKVVKYLNSTDWTSEVRDGSQGQVMVEIPDHYTCYRMTGNKMQVWISQIPIPGYIKVNKVYVSAYEASLSRSALKLASVVNTDVDYRGGNNNVTWDGTYRSLLGRPATVLTRTQMRSYARKRNINTTEWNIDLYSAHLAMYWLYVIEYANLNSQLPYNPAKDANGFSQGGLGNGVTTLASADWNSWNGTYPFVACGHTDALGNGTGEIPYTLLNSDGSTLATVQVPRYRGIENPFGHIWKWLDGINIDIKTDADGGTSTVYRCDDPEKFVDNGYAYYRNIGLMARSEGYIREIIFGDGGDILAKTVGGGSSSYFADYNYTSVTTSSLRAVLVGGSANAGATAGLSSASSLYAPSATSAYIGSRLCFLPRVR